jgi:hypothetical protein
LNRRAPTHDPAPESLARRRACARIAGFGALVLTAVEVVRMPTAVADEATRRAFHYQDFPNSNLRCELCTYFVPGTKAGTGVCRIIDGEVSAAGWCQAFRPK